MKIRIKNSILEVEIADSDISRSQGLQGRSALEEDSGMLFVFDYPDSYSFHMQNVKLPLDLIFINSDGQILKIVSAFPEEVMISGAKDTKYVVETNLGWCNQNNVNLGDKVMLSKRQERIASRKEAQILNWDQQDVKTFLSQKLKQVPDRALANVLRDALFTLGRVNWLELAKSIAKHMPEERANIYNL